MDSQITQVPPVNPMPPAQDLSGGEGQGAVAPDSLNQPPQDDSATPQPPIPNESALIPGFSKPVKEEVLLEWQAPSRPFKKHNRQFYTTIGVIVMLIALILFFAGQVLPVAVVLAVAFLSYVINTTQPGMVVYQLTNYGIRIEKTLYYWEEMGRFWFTQKYGQDMIHIEVAQFPNRITMLLGEMKKEDFEAIFSEILLHQEPPPTAYEKGAKWLHDKIPIDLES